MSNQLPVVPMNQYNAPPELVPHFLEKHRQAELARTKEERDDLIYRVALCDQYIAKLETADPANVSLPGLERG